MKELINVLVVDDSAIFRKIISDIIAAWPDFNVVGVAVNGRDALMKIARLKPHLVILDMEMPVMNGLETLQAIQDQYPEVETLMCSVLTQRAAEITMKALEFGAFDFIPKPDADSAEENRRLLTSELRAKAQVFRIRRNLRSRPRKPPPIAPRPATQFNATSIQARMKKISGQQTRIQVVALGISTGGPRALMEVIPQLSRSFPVPLLIVQHMPALFTKSLANSLDQKSAVRVVEASDGDKPKPGTVYIAQGHRQMQVELDDSEATVIRITDDPPELNCRPSANILFRSVAKVYGASALGVIMTGIGSDGTDGLKSMKQKGCTILGQDEASCVVYGMPKEAVRAGVVSSQVSLENMAREIEEQCG